MLLRWLLLPCISFLRIYAQQARRLSAYECFRCKVRLGRDVCKQYGAENYKIQRYYNGREECVYVGRKANEEEGDLMDGDIKLPGPMKIHGVFNVRQFTALINDKIRQKQRSEASYQNRWTNCKPRCPQHGWVGPSSMGTPYQTWPDGNVPYDIDEKAFTLDEVQVIKNAIKEIEDKTCVKFVKVENRFEPHLRIVSEAACWSYVGMQLDRSPQKLSLGSSPGVGYCVTHGHALHELMHALGFLHEQSRPDRDRYVKINMSNVHEDRTTNFAKADVINMTEYGLTVTDVGYDYSSVMHYKSTAFAKQPWLKTIVAIDQNGRENQTATDMIGQREHLSTKDVLEIKLLYNCPMSQTTAETTPPRRRTTPPTTSPTTTKRRTRRTTRRANARTSSSKPTKNPDTDLHLELKPDAMMDMCRDANIHCREMMSYALCDNFKILQEMACRKTCSGFLNKKCSF